MEEKILRQTDRQTDRDKEKSETGLGGIDRTARVDAKKHPTRQTCGKSDSADQAYKMIGVGDVEATFLYAV